MSKKCNFVGHTVHTFLKVLLKRKTMLKMFRIEGTRQ